MAGETLGDQQQWDTSQCLSLQGPEEGPMGLESRKH